MGERPDTRAAYERFRGEMIKNGTDKKVATEKARKAAERHDRRRESSR